MTETTTDERLDRIRATAAEHDGRFMLPRRLWKDPLDTTMSEVDLDYDACYVLIDKGEARWIAPYHGGPGIQIVRPPAVPAPPPGLMSLDEALRRLAEVHTRDDHELGFQVVIGARPDLALIRGNEYVRAWAAVRWHLHLQVDPPEER